MYISECFLRLSINISKNKFSGIIANYRIVLGYTSICMLLICHIGVGEKFDAPEWTDRNRDRDRGRDRDRHVFISAISPMEGSAYRSCQKQ